IQHADAARRGEVRNRCKRDRSRWQADVGRRPRGGRARSGSQDRRGVRSGDLFAPPPQPRAQAEPAGDLSPAALATAHLAAARANKIDRSKYETVRTLDRLKAWVLRAKEIGVVAIDTE